MNCRLLKETYRRLLFKKVCGCLSLRTGAFCVCILISLLGGIVHFIVEIASLISYFSAGDDESMDNSTESENSRVVLSCFQLIVSILTIVFAILALFSAYKNRKHRFLVPWMIWNLILMMIGSGYMFYCAILQWTQEEFAMGLSFFAASLSILVMSFLSWWVIFSYHHELRKANKEKTARNFNPIAEYPLDEGSPLRTTSV